MLFNVFADVTLTESAYIWCSWQDLQSLVLVTLQAIRLHNFLLFKQK